MPDFYLDGQTNRLKTLNRLSNIRLFITNVNTEIFLSICCQICYKYIFVNTVKLYCFM